MMAPMRQWECTRIPIIVSCPAANIEIDMRKIGAIVTEIQKSTRDSKLGRTRRYSTSSCLLKLGLGLRLKVGRRIGIVFRWILIFRYSDLGLGCF